MLRLLARPLACATLAGGLWAAEPGPAPLPPLSGDLVGQLALPRIPGLPPLDWRVQFRPAGGANLAFDASASAPGFEVQLALTLPRGETPGAWRIVSAKIDAAYWWKLTAELGGVKSLPPDFEFTGQVTLTGSGSWRGAEASGALHTTLAASTARSSLQNWTASGLTIEGDLDLAASRVTLREAHVRADTVQTAGVTLRNLVFDTAGAEGGRVAVRRAELTAFGGQITLAPFEVDPAKVAFTTSVDFPNVVLADVVPLVPQALKEAKGRITGRVLVHWDSKEGLVSAEGRLATLPGETAVLRLAGYPGLLSSRMPERIALVSLLSLRNPAIDTLRRVELGEDTLIVDRLNIDLFSLTGASARTARINIVGHPTNDRDVKRITLEVNVAGPLNQVVKLGVGKGASIQMRSGK
ncbi:MAG: YdbH domain-containing protein [Verrucomicrobia bacterium]|nr:YdbH domain-containing protein [Verrucomicrobiota bacterium]